MLKFYYNAAPNPLKVGLFLEESGLPYEGIAVDTRRGQQHDPAFLAINPNAKVPAIVDGDAVVFEHPDAVTSEPDARGRAQVGQGDNVIRHAAAVIGTARYIRTNDRVLQYLTEGVPPGTIAVIDDSGGTLTAPIIEHFAGILCAGGTVRSHLGILSREYGIPCFMNAKLNGIRDGDMVEMEATADSRTTEDYQSGTERYGRVWRLAEAG